MGRITQYRLTRKRSSHTYLAPTDALVIVRLVAALVRKGHTVRIASNLATARTVNADLQAYAAVNLVGQDHNVMSRAQATVVVKVTAASATMMRTKGRRCANALRVFGDPLAKTSALRPLRAKSAQAGGIATR